MRTQKIQIDVKFATGFREAFAYCIDALCSLPLRVSLTSMSDSIPRCSAFRLPLCSACLFLLIISHSTLVLFAFFQRSNAKLPILPVSKTFHSNIEQHCCQLSVRNDASLKLINKICSIKMKPILNAKFQTKFGKYY